MVYDLTKGFWDRWVLLDFPYTFVTQEEYDTAVDKSKLKIRDESIIDKITTPSEMSGFLNASLDGLERLIKNRKFSATKGSEEVKSTWIRRSNSFIAFCYENLEESFDGKINKKDLRKRYADYCKRHNVSSKSDVVLKRVLQDLYGATDDRLSTGFPSGNYEWFWQGIKWKEETKSTG